MLKETTSYFTACTNCVACIIMGLVILLVHKLTRATTTGHTSIQTICIKRHTRINTLVTGVHIVLILVYTVISIVIFNVPRLNGVEGESVAGYTILTAWVLCGGFLDLLLTCMMFFILDEELKVDFLHEERRNVNYAVLDVIDKEATHVSN
jgi:hypothetical protein